MSHRPIAIAGAGGAATSTLTVLAHGGTPSNRPHRRGLDGALRTAAHHLRVYGKLLMLHQRAHLEYEADFWIGIVGAFLTHAAGFVFVWVFFSRIPEIAGWTLWEVAFLYGLATLPQGLREIFCDGSWQLRLLVNRGELDRVLVRPISPALQVVTQLSSIHGLGGVLLGGYVLARAASELELAWGPWQYAFLVLTLFSSVLLVGAIDYATNCVGFWEPSANSAFPFLVHNLSEFAKFPITVYGRLVQTVVTWVLPFAFVSYYPGMVLLGRPDAHPWLGYGAPLASLAALAIAGLIWRLGLARYQGVGH